MALKAAE